MRPESLPNPPKKPVFSVVERRDAPRYLVNLACLVTTPDNVSAPGRISDLSLTGLQLNGNTEFVHKLYPNFKRADWRTPLKVKIEFSLPTSGKQSVAVSILCQLVYCRRRQEHCFKIGCQYLEVGAEAQTALMDHIQHFGVPKGT